MRRKLSRQLYGVLGFPAKHSLSPLMHNAAFARLKINAEYRIFEKSPEALGDFLLSLPAAGIRGLNVTVPYKEKVIRYLYRLSPEARSIGAVNTIKVRGTRLYGFNTDGAGFLRHIAEDLKFKARGKRIALLGAGGAARAVSFALLKERPASLAIYDIDRKKLSSLAAALRGYFKKAEIKTPLSAEGLFSGGCDMLINATPVGMKEADACPIEGRFIHRQMLVYDLIYNPSETKLLKEAKSRGARTANGLGMLLYQGMVSFQVWTGKRAPRQAMFKALTKGALA